MSKKVVVTVDRTGARTVDLRSLLTSDAAKEQLAQLRRASPTAKPDRTDSAGHRRTDRS